MKPNTVESFDHPDFAIWIHDLKKHGGLNEDGTAKDDFLLTRNAHDPSLWLAMWKENGLQYGLEFGGSRIEMHPIDVEMPRLDPADILAALIDMTDDERLEIISHFCRHCGYKDPSCQCWNDE